MSAFLFVLLLDDEIAPLPLAPLLVGGKNEYNPEHYTKRSTYRNNLAPQVTTNATTYYYQQYSHQGIVLLGGSLLAPSCHSSTNSINLSFSFVANAY
jgi:hypothetical protein